MDGLAGIGIIIVVAIIVLGGVGYVKNVAKLCHADFHTVNAENVLRTAGLFVPPLGVVEGYVDFDRVTEREQKAGK